ncbi:juvenile hormone esterase-like [Leptidea sinapis]|uniref:juvenile hormone esterase-like n=1 Tax=Leptidea sinapis TaxID=189913 RepID=UPI0021C35A94|nr:juvenile hormone esterase-like [Leptidea sinapis]
MYKHYFTFLIQLSLSLFLNVCSIQVKVTEGILEGEIVNNKYGAPFHSFKGIPFAAAPIGDLRFQTPEPALTWDGVRDAKVEGSVCFHYDLLKVRHPSHQGSEDCLFPNVYSPNVTTEVPYPVMVWIHGGGFISDSSDEYKPEFILRKDVILVTINYRLGVLGFLSLEAEDIPGNAGMKDQVAALRWVKKNIKDS